MSSAAATLLELLGSPHPAWPRRSAGRAGVAPRMAREAHREKRQAGHVLSAERQLVANQLLL